MIVDPDPRIGNLTIDKYHAAFSLGGLDPESFEAPGLERMKVQQTTGGVKHTSDISVFVKQEFSEN